MREKTKLVVLLLSTLVVTYGLVGGVLQKVSAGDDAYDDLAVFSKVIDHLQRDYVENPDMKKALKGALQGMVEALDPFSSYVDGETYEALAQPKGDAQIGVSLSKRYGYAYIVAVEEGSPAEENGLRSGDMIEAIEGQPTVLMSVWEAERRLLGPVGSAVNLRVIRSRRSEPQDLSLERATPPVQVPSARLVQENLGYLRIPNFDKGSVEMAKTKIKVLLSSGAKGILLDLRSTADGELEEGVAMADALLPVGAQISVIKTRKGDTSVYSSTSEPVVKDLPVVILVDGGTSGPAEVLAAALKDNGIADTVGERSNGHGSIQHEFILRSGAHLFLSTGLLVRPDGKPLQSEEYRDSGLEPDVLSPAREFISNFYFDNSTGAEDEELGDDFYARLDSAIDKQQFDAAVSHLQEKIRSEGNKIQREAA